MTVELRYGQKVTASKATLNYLSSAIHHAARDYERDGFPALANEAHENSKAIYNALDATGFYDEFR